MMDAWSDGGFSGVYEYNKCRTAEIKENQIMEAKSQKGPIVGSDITRSIGKYINVKKDL